MAMSGIKRPSHGKLKLANSCWQTQVALYERHKTVVKHVGKQLVTIELAYILANFFVLVISYLTCEHVLITVKQSKHVLYSRDLLT